MVGDFEFGEFEAVRGADDDDFFIPGDFIFTAEFGEGTEGDSGVRAAVESCAIGPVCGIGEFLFRDGDDHAVVVFDGAFRFGVAYGVADLDGAREGFFRFDGNEFVEAPLIGLVEGVGVFGLSDDDAWLFIDEAHGEAVVKAFGEGTDVAEVAAWDDDGVGDVPIELLTDFRADGFLTFNAEAVHGICKVNAVVGGDLLHDLHAAVKVGIESKHDAAVANGLYQLGDAGFARREKYDARNSCFGAKSGKRGGGVPGACAGNGVNGGPFFDHVIDLAHEYGHAQVFEASRVGVAAEFDKELVHAELFGERTRVK